MPESDKVFSSKFIESGILERIKGSIWDITFDVIASVSIVCSIRGFKESNLSSSWSLSKTEIPSTEFFLTALNGMTILNSSFVPNMYIDTSSITDSVVDWIHSGVALDFNVVISWSSGREIWYGSSGIFFIADEIAGVATLSNIEL